MPGMILLMAVIFLTACFWYWCTPAFVNRHVRYHFEFVEQQVIGQRKSAPMEGRDKIAKARTGSQVSSSLHALPCKHCDPHCQKSSGDADPSCRPAKARSHFDVSYNVLLGVALHEASRHPRGSLPLGLDPNLVLFDRA